MEFSLAYEMQRPTPDDHAVIQETIEQCILADQMGFDAVWFVEHHFLTTFSMSPCPEVILTAIAAQTKRIRLGFGVVILPYHHPVRVAERIAMLDHISNGRVEFGTGRSAPYEQTGMGIDPQLTRDMWEESLTMIPKIWESDMFTWEGRFWNVPPREVLPKPYQKPHPPIWVAALQPATYALAAQKGIGVMALGVSAPSVLEPHIRSYRDAIKEADPVGGYPALHERIFFGLRRRVVFLQIIFPRVGHTIASPVLQAAAPKEISGTRSGPSGPRLPSGTRRIRGRCFCCRVELC